MTCDPAQFKEYVGPYVGAEAVVISSTNHVFSNLPNLYARALVVTASGNVIVVLADGTSVTIPVVVASNDYVILDGNGKGLLIASVTKTGTTATVPYGLY